MTISTGRNYDTDSDSDSEPKVAVVAMIKM